MDHHARKEADVTAFLTAGDFADVKATLHTDSSAVPIQLSAEGRETRVVMGKKFTSEERNKAVEEDFRSAVTSGSGGNDFMFKVSFAPYSIPHAETSWLRAAYLAFFAALGYTFILGAELNPVREKIKDPKSKVLQGFRMRSREPWKPTLLLVNEPAPFRSYLMTYKHDAIFLPRMGDQELYDRLAAAPVGEVKFDGKAYQWPTRPRFLFDEAVAKEKAQAVTTV